MGESVSAKRRDPEHQGARRGLSRNTRAYFRGGRVSCTGAETPAAAPANLPHFPEAVSARGASAGSEPCPAFRSSEHTKGGPHRNLRDDGSHSSLFRKRLVPAKMTATTQRSGQKMPSPFSFRLPDVYGDAESRGIRDSAALPDTPRERPGRLSRASCIRRNLRKASSAPAGVAEPLPSCESQCCVRRDRLGRCTHSA